MEQQSERRVIRAESAADPVTFTTQPRHFLLYRVTETEIDQLAVGSNSFSMALCGIAAGAAITGATTLLTASLSVTLIAIFTGLTTATTGLAFFFGLAAIRERRDVFRTVERIKGRGPSVD